MTEARIPSSPDSSAGLTPGDVVVMRLLAEVASLTDSSAVRKTTISALLAAIEEQVDAGDLGRISESLSGSGLGDALLDLRWKGLVTLTDQGFRLTDTEHAHWTSDSSHQDLYGSLKGLVSRKMQEWQLVSRPA